MPSCAGIYQSSLGSPMFNVGYTSPHLRTNGFDVHVGVSTDEYHSMVDCGSTINTNEYLRTTTTDFRRRVILNDYWYMNTTNPVHIGSDAIHFDAARGCALPQKVTGVYTGGVSQALTSQLPVSYGAEIDACSIVAHIIGNEFVSPLLSLREYKTIVSNSSHLTLSDIKEINTNIAMLGIQREHLRTVRNTNINSKLIIDSLEYNTDRLWHHSGWADYASMSAWRDISADMLIMNIPMQHGCRSVSLDCVVHYADWFPAVSSARLGEIISNDMRICQRTYVHILHKWYSQIAMGELGPYNGNVSIIKTPSDCAVCINDHVVSYTHGPSFMMFGSLFVDMLDTY